MKKSKKPQKRKYVRKPFRVAIIESERGWGRKVDEIKKFATLDEAQKFVKTFNKKNEDDWNKTHEVPDWYMQAELLSPEP